MILRTTTSIVLIGLLAASNFVMETAEAGLHSGIRQIFSGPAAYETCALMADRRTYCWGFTPGASALGQIGKNFQSMALGRDFRCALTTDGKVSCWGNNGYSQLGDGTTVSRDTPQPVQYDGSDFDRVTAISAGYGHVCAIRDGAAWCWGSNVQSEIGNFTLPATMNAAAPTPVVVNVSGSPPLNNLTYISAGRFHTCALFADTTGACWGYDDYGQLGNNHTLANFNSPQTILVDSGGLVSLGMGGGLISAGGYATCALVSDIVANSVACWGYNLQGELGVGTKVDSSTAMAATDERGKIVDAVDVAEGSYTTCAVMVNTTVRCWGLGADGELGSGGGSGNVLTGTVLLSDAGTPFTGAIQVVAGAQHMCVRTIHDEVYCWGDNTYGQIGSSGGGKIITPTKVAIDATLFADGLEGE